MKVCSSPVPFSEPDYRNYDVEAERRREAEHEDQTRQWLKNNGYTGPRTGEIVRFGHADGYANYMYACGGRTSILIHLPYGDAWDSPLAHYMPKRDVLKQLDSQKRIAEIFGRKVAA